jgi:hypothetical protein
MPSIKAKNCKHFWQKTLHPFVICLYKNINFLLTQNHLIVLAFDMSMFKDDDDYEIRASLHYKDHPMVASTENYIYVVKTS